MNINRRGFLALSATGVATALLAACSSHSSDSSSTGNKDGTYTLRVAGVAAGAQATVDPHGSLFSESDWFRLSCIYDNLLLEDGDKLIPRLATKWESNEAADKWTFTLRDDAKFSDGSPVTAHDVFYSLQRMDKKKNENGVRLGTVDMSKSRILDDHKVELVTSIPDAELPRLLSCFVLIVKKGTENFKKPVGSGPFVLDSLDATNAVLSKNPTWWGDEPCADKLEINGFSDPQAMANAATTSAVDIASGITPAAAKTLEGEGSMKIRRRRGAETYPLLLRVDAAPFDNNDVREAIKLGIDRQAMVDAVFLGYGEVGADMIKLTDPSVPKDVSPIKRDVDKAKKLLADAGHRDGLKLTLHTTQSYPGMLTTATVAQKQLEDIGVHVEVKEHSPDEYWSSIYTKEPFTVGMYTNTPFAVTVRQTVLSDAPFSETGYKDPVFDKAFEHAMSMTDANKRNAELAQLHKKMAREGGWVVWGFGDGLDAIADGVDHWRGDPARFNLDGVTKT